MKTKETKTTKKKTAVKKPAAETAAAEEPYPCQRCGAVCCKHVALEIDKPTTKAEYDYVRWYLLHKKTEIFIDGGKWYLKVETECEKLLPDGRCGIYEKRPSICREYPPKDRECEFEGKEPYYDLRFSTVEEFEKHMDKSGKNWRTKYKN
ncbi:MAG: YkgJ family cysteine cluster protein [Spirochaetota bacterium]